MSHSAKLLSLLKMVLFIDPPSLAISKCGASNFQFRVAVDGISWTWTVSVVVFCLTWRHSRCIGLDCRPPGRQYLCCDCQENKTCSTLDPGGINQASRRRKRGPGCHVNVAGRPKILQLRLSRPAYLRPELRLLGNLVSIPPSLIDYAIHFGGVFSGRMLG